MRKTVSTEYRSTENRSTENRSTENRSTENRSTKTRSTEIRSGGCIKKQRTAVYRLAAELSERLLRLLFPVRCPVCDRPVPRREGLICEACYRRLPFVREPYCMKCGKPLTRSEEEYCRDCMSAAHAFEKGRAILHYEGEIRKSIYRFKYAGRREYARAYALLAKEHLAEFIRATDAQAIVPVPLHTKRYRKRGYNQAELLAGEIGRIFSIPVETHLVKRVRNTVPQKQLDLAGRQNNLKRAFKICRNDVKLKTIIIVDDIYTTGSTVDALSRELRQHGVERIYVLALACGK